VRVPAPRREALLDEFEKGGASGAKFARLAGIKYSTFANWVQQRGKRQAPMKPARGEAPNGTGLAGPAGPIRLLEAMVEGGAPGGREPVRAEGLVVELPGGSRLVVGSPVQLQMAAELVALIAQRARVRC
jgi:hypothetical protein